MKTNLTRNSFDPAKHFSSVRLKQGAMQLDADWNEQVDILARREHSALTDIVGQAGVPAENGGFRIVAAVSELTAEEQANPANAFTATLAARDLLITAGRAYVNGRLIENDEITILSDQTDTPGQGVLPLGRRSSSGLPRCLGPNDHQRRRCQYSRGRAGWSRYRDTNEMYLAGAQPSGFRRAGG